MDELRAEYREMRIGPLIYRKTLAAAYRVAPSYPPAVCSPDGHSWGREAIEDLVQEFIFEDLHRRGQIDYLMLQASEPAFDALLRRRLKWHIFKRARPTEVDNLRERSLKLLDGPGYQRRTAGGEVLYARATGSVERRRPTQSEREAAARAVRDVPRVHSRASLRASQVYQPKQLAEAVRLIAHSLPCEFTSWDLHDIFCAVLTWTQTRAVPLEDDVLGRADSALGGWEEAEVRDAVLRVTAKLSDRERRLLVLKLRRTSDEAVGEELGVSRTTIDCWRRKVAAMVVQELDGLRTDLRSVARARLAHVLEGGPLDG